MNDSRNKGHVTETPDTSYIRNLDTMHEVSDVRVGGIIKFCIGLFLLLVVASLVVWGMFRMLAVRAQEPPPSPMALRGEERLPPEPRLQSAPGFAETLEKNISANESEQVEAAAPRRSLNPKSPLWEIKALQNQWNDVLQHGPVDKDGQRYGMPIEQAKQEILKRGLGEK